MSSEISSKKHRFTIYLRPQEREYIDSRTDTLSMNMSEYIAELVMWDQMHKIIEKARANKLGTN